MRRISSVPGPRLKSEFAPGAISPDGRTLAYGLPDGTVHFFDVATGKAIAGTGAHAAGVTRMAFSSDSRTVVSTGDDALAILWNPATGVPLERLTGHAGRILWPDFSADGKTLYTPSLDGTILQYDLAGDRRFGSPFNIGVAGLRAQTLDAAPLLAVSPGGRSFAASVSESRVSLFSTSTLRRMATISLASRRTVGAGAWAGDRFVLGADRGLVQIWDVAGVEPKPFAALHGLSHQGQLRSVATGAGGRVVAAVDSWDGPDPKNGGPPPHEGELGIWRDGRLVGKPINLNAYGNAVAMSRDGSTVAVATDDGARASGRCTHGPGATDDSSAGRPRQRYDSCVLARRNAGKRLLGRHCQPLGSEDGQGVRPPHSRRPGSGERNRVRPGRQEVRDDRRLQRSHEGLGDIHPPATRRRFPGR